MKNKEIILKEIERIGCTLGCWDNMMEKLSKTELKKVLENIEFEADTDVKINRKQYVVQIDNVDEEIDFNIITREEYIDQCGDERYYEED